MNHAQHRTDEPNGEMMSSTPPGPADATEGGSGDASITKASSGHTDALPRRPSWMLWTSLVGLTLFAAVAVHIALVPDSPVSQGMDDAWRARIGSPGPENGLLVIFFQYLGRAKGVAVVSAVLLAALACARRWRHAVFFVVAVDVGAVVAAYIPKYLVGRPRPALDLDAGLYGPLFAVDHGSFPSGHSVAVGVMIVGIAALFPARRRLIWWTVGVLLAVGVVWQRTLVNAHWLSDTLAGLTVGACTAMLAWWALYPLLAQDRGRPLRPTRIIPEEEAVDPAGGRSER